MDQDEQTSFGVFKPVGHTVISFPSADQADQARTALGRLGVSGDAILSYTDREMLLQIDRDITPCEQRTTSDRFASRFSVARGL